MNIFFWREKPKPKLHPSQVVAWFANQSEYKQDALLGILNKIRTDEKYAADIRLRATLELL